MPKAANLDKILLTGGPVLTFSMKTCRPLTHEINPSSWEREAKAYWEAIDPVFRARWLEAVLFHSLPKFTNKADSRRYLDKLLVCF
jgi:hypothetical protein